MHQAIFFPKRAPIAGSIFLLVSMLTAVVWMAPRATVPDVIGGVVLAGAAAYYLMAEIFVRRMKRAIPRDKAAFSALNDRMTRGRFVPLAISSLTFDEISVLQGEDAWSQQFCSEMRSLKRWAKIWSLPMKSVIFYFALRYILRYF
jgi:hypothetical protein